MPIGELYEVILIVGTDGAGALRQEFGAKAGGLHIGAAGEIFSADAGGESQIILDFGTRPSLSAGGIGLDDQGLEAFGASIDCSCESRPVPHLQLTGHKVLSGLGSQANFAGKLGLRRLDQRGAVGERNGGELAIVYVELLQEVTGFFIVLGIEPDVRNLVAGQKIADLVIAEDPRGPMTRMPSNAGL